MSTEQGFCECRAQKFEEALKKFNNISKKFDQNLLFLVNFIPIIGKDSNLGDV